MRNQRSHKRLTVSCGRPVRTGWIQSVRGKFVVTGFPQPTCRPDSHYVEFGTPGALDRLKAAREEAMAEF